MCQIERMRLDGSVQIFKTEGLLPGQSAFSSSPVRYYIDPDKLRALLFETRFEELKSWGGRWNPPAKGVDRRRITFANWGELRK